MLSEKHVFVVVVGCFVLEIGEFIEFEIKVGEKFVVLDLQLPVESVEFANLILEHEPQGDLFSEGPLVLLVTLFEHAAVQLQLFVFGLEFAVFAVYSFVLVAV